MVTPATDNFLAIAAEQAAVDLDTPYRFLELLTASIKFGIEYLGLLNLNDQIAHNQRVHLCIERSPRLDRNVENGVGHPGSVVSGVLCVQFLVSNGRDAQRHLRDVR